MEDFNTGNNFLINEDLNDFCNTLNNLNGYVNDKFEKKDCKILGINLNEV